MQVMLRSLAESSIRSLHSQGVLTQGTMTDALAAPVELSALQAQAVSTQTSPAVAATGTQKQKRMQRYARLPGRRFGHRTSPLVIINSGLNASLSQQRNAPGPSRLSIGTSVGGLEAGSMQQQQQV